MWTEFLLISGWVFWACALGVVVLIALCLRHDEDGPTGLAVALAMSALVLTAAFTDAFAGWRWTVALGLFAAYLILGVGWAFWKWESFTSERAAELRKEYHDAPATSKNFRDWAEHRIPTALQNKQRLTGWMALWPFSATWWLLTWPRQIFSAAWRWLSGAFDRMARRKFRDEPGDEPGAVGLAAVGKAMDPGALGGGSPRSGL